MRKLLVILLLVVGFIFIFFYVKKLIFRNSYSIGGIRYEIGYDKYNSVVKKAAKINEPSICNEINFGQDHGDYRTSAEESRYFCIADYAVEIGDVEFCETLDAEMKFVGAITQKNKCLRGLAIKLNDKSLCEKMTKPYVAACKQMVEDSK